MNYQQAQAFFDQLTTFSKRVFTFLAMPEHSPWGHAHWQGGKPTGAVIHYTADEDVERVLRWFMRERFNAKASAHVVVCREKMAQWVEHEVGLPLVQALPVTVIQCRLPGSTAWHAPGYNGTCYGIENINDGQVYPVDAGFVNWRGQGQVENNAAVTEWARDDAVPLFGNYWAQYSLGQIAVNVTLLRAVQGLFGSLEYQRIVGHENTQAGKRDPGPDFPLHGVRRALFVESPVEEHDWYKLVVSDHLHGRTEREQIAQAYWRERKRVNYLGDAAYELLLKHSTEGPVPFMLLRALMQVLGYAVDHPTFDDPLTDAEDVSVSIAQSALGLGDGEIKLSTLLQALLSRANDLYPA